MNELQKAIEKSGLTDKELARVLDISVPTVNRWRTGKNGPHKLALPRLIKEIKEL